MLAAMEGALLLMAAHAAAMSGAPTAAEMAERDRWVSAKLRGPPSELNPDAGLEVLANYGPVQQNTRGAGALNITGRRFTQGLYCHANSTLLARLPSPGKGFSARAGVDTNDQTVGGRGSVVFAVKVGEREAFRSDARREGMPALSVEVDLGGAREFVLAVEDAGDGFACDQADWAEARVELADGSVLWLGDLPILDPFRPAPDASPFFSFAYGGRPSAELLPGWRLERSAREVQDPRHGARTEHTLTYTDPATDLVVRCVGTEYSDFPTVEWTLCFENTGAADTPILSDIRAIDTRLDAGPYGEFVLHHIRGDDCTPESYEPLLDALGPSADLRLANTGGRPTQLAFPYYNLNWSGQGVICVLGWPGQWSMQFARDEGAALRVVGGQELTHFVLHPGEQVRTPLVVLQFYKGDWLHAQNVWRRWMLAHNLPMPGGQPLATRRSLCTGNYYPSLMTVAETERAFLQRHLDERIEFDWWWQDAGWYPCDGVGWPKVGTWEPDPVRFPKGLRELSDLMHAHGKRAIVWFEPERVHPGTWIAENHPEWVHGGAEGGLLKLSDSACRAWLTDHIDRLLTEQGIDDYRQDFNIDPLPYWRASDAEDRQGITEIRHVEGYLAYWDELLRRHPDMLIDSCASGGRRNDLETLRRAVPLLRSDWYWSPEGQQCLTYGLSLWFPYQGTGFVLDRDAYWVRSSMVAEMSFGPDAAGLDRVDFARLRRLVHEHRLISPSFLGDYYPLTSYTQSPDHWMAWQFHRPDLGEGVVQAFRRPESPYESCRFRLRGLDPQARYVFTDLDDPAPVTLDGQVAMDEGVLITIREQPAAAVIGYKVTDGAG